MTTINLLTLIGHTDDTYLLPAVENTPAVHSSHRLRRVWLIAAIISLLLLVGWTIYLFTLNNLSFGPREIVDTDGRVFLYEPLSMQGFENSPTYKAAREWFEFTETYDPDYAILNSLSPEDTQMPRIYDCYLCYTKEMCDKVDEICLKYDLEPMGPLLTAYYREDLLQALNMPEVLRIDLLRESTPYGGYYYQSGTFDLGGVLSLGERADLCPYPINYRMHCSMKSSFDSVYRSLSGTENYEEWYYTHEDGTPLLLALSTDDAIIIAGRKDAFITIQIHLDPIDGTPSSAHLDKLTVEAVADVFDFTVHPAPKISPDNAT